MRGQVVTRGAVSDKVQESGGRESLTHTHTQQGRVLQVALTDLQPLFTLRFLMD